MNKRHFVRLAALALACCLAAGCAGRPAPGADGSAPGADGSAAQGAPVSLRFSWWGSETRHEATLAVIEQYQTAHSHVRISGVYGGFDGYYTKLVTQLSGQSAADLIQLDAPFVGDLRTKGDFFVDLSEYADTLDLSGFDPDFLERWCYSGDQLIGVPTGINSLVLIVNGGLLRQAGIDPAELSTWEGLIAAGKKLHTFDPDCYMLTFGKQDQLQNLLQPLVFQLTGKQIVSDDFELQITREQLIAAFEIISRLYSEGATEPAASAKVFEAEPRTNPGWLNGQRGCALCESSTLNADYYAPFADTVTVVSLPVMENAADTGIWSRPSQLLAVNKASANPQEAVRFMQYFFNDETALQTLGCARGTPANEMGRAVCAQADILDPVASEAVAVALENSGSAANDATNNSEVQEIFFSAFDRLAYFDGTVEEIADETIRLLENTLAALREA